MACDVYTELFFFSNQLLYCSGCGVLMKCCAEVQLSENPLFEHAHTFLCRELTATVSLLSLMIL